ncbi:DUF6005 family protein [Halomonas sp. BC04]|uniref:DUF6005 family protein n=1 Tax=Halomonas sp. BC04 TaxID=1403540 RepID=UPI0003ED858E|nr:DUF6005 family protein [Halomonas sp. BC04]EWH00382.1 Petrobactin biosynthesis protein AsbE [Halomonas sp. BC04]
MIKVHCFVSCVCEIIKRTPGVDHRPFYFGVWDADFSVNSRHELSYHSPHTRHEGFREWYRLLYGIRIVEWYEHERDKEANVARLIELVEQRPADRQVMVMLDMYRLPERDNKFHQNPFPHYVMLEATPDPAVWFMSDPDFRWEGELPKARILDAVRSPAAGGGFYFDGLEIRHTPRDTVAAYFRQCMKRDENPFTDALRRILHAHVGPGAHEPLAHLAQAFREVPVMAIRKYAYEHAFAWLLEAQGQQAEGDPLFEAWCDEIEALVKTYTRIQYRAMKLAMTGNPALASAVEALLEEQDIREFRIKRGLQALFSAWCQGQPTPVPTPTTRQTEPMP